MADSRDQGRRPHCQTPLDTQLLPQRFPRIVWDQLGCRIHIASLYIGADLRIRRFGMRGDETPTMRGACGLYLSAQALTVRGSVHPSVCTELVFEMATFWRPQSIRGRPSVEKHVSIYPVEHRD